MNRHVVKASSRSEPRLHFPQGSILFREGDLGTEMFVIHQGRVEIFQKEGGGERSLAVLEPGDFFGEISLLDDLPRSASARASTDVIVIEVRRSTFVDLLRRHPEIAVRMLRKLTRRLRQTDALLRAESKGETMMGLDEAFPRERPVAPVRGDGCLFHAATGTRFPLAGERTTLGRFDPVTGVRPDIDLTEIDTGRTSSRRHAALLSGPDGFLLVEEIGVVNGTWVDGKRLTTGEPVPVARGNVVKLGRVELELEAG